MAFLSISLNFGKNCFEKCGEYLLVQNLGHNHPKKCKISCLVGLLNEKQWSSFVHFLYFTNPLTLLTICALVRKILTFKIGNYFLIFQTETFYSQQKQGKH